MPVTRWSMTVPLHDTDDASPIPGGRRNQVSPLGGGESRWPAASSARPAPWPRLFPFNWRSCESLTSRVELP